MTTTQKIIEAMEASRNESIELRTMQYGGGTAQNIQAHTDMTLKQVRSALSKMERTGEVKSIVYKMQGTGRKNTRQTFRAKQYRLIQS